MVTISLTEDKCGQTSFKSLLWDPKPHLGHSYRFRVLRSQRKLRGTHWWRRSTPQAGFKQSHSAFYRAWVLLQPLGGKTLIAFFFSLWKSLWLCVTGRQNHIGSRGPRDVAQKPAPFCTHGHLFLLLLELQLSPAASGCASFWKVGNSSSIISLLEGQMGFESQQTVPCLLNKNQEKLEWKKKKSNNGENKGYISKIFPFLWAQQRSLSSFEERQVGGWQVHFL